MRFLALVILSLYPLLSCALPTSLNIEINGLNNQDKASVLSKLTIEATKDYKDLSADELNALKQLTLTELKTSLETLGYYHSSIASEILTQGNQVTIKYTINPGNPVLIKQCVISLLGTGRNKPDLLAL